MAETRYDYQRLYRGFCSRLREDSNLKFSHYCREAGVPWRRLYDWMSRRKISLKRLYAGDGRDLETEIQECGDSRQPGDAFIPLEVRKSPEVSIGVSADGMSVCVELPSGANMRISGCSVHDVVVMLGGPLMGTGNV